MSAPNFLWIVTTQWRAQATGYAGDSNARTPHLDRLAAQSANYTQAVTPHPMGPFARAALLTGVVCPQNGVRDYFDPLPENARTVAVDLRARGYRTAFFGKWHLGEREAAVPLVGEAHARTIVPPARRGGFEFWEGFESGFLLNDPWLHGSELPEPTRFYGYQSEVLVDRFEAWRRKQPADRPFFSLLSLEAPHPPYDAPAGGVGWRHPDEIVLPANVPRGGPVETKARRELAGYYAHIEATDRAIGRLLATLDETWTVVFTSVHGDMHGAHGLFRKGWPHEESIRVPLLVHRPGAEPRLDASAISLVDLPALTMALMEQRSMAPAEFARISMPSVVRLPHQCDQAWRGLRTKTRKLVLNEDGSPWLFFDLERDPAEQKNLVYDQDRAAEIRALGRMIGEGEGGDSNPRSKPS
jgi:arylsulfatase A-like enzyme